MDTQSPEQAPPIPAESTATGATPLEERRARRRRLLKGLLALGATATPLVMTLQNGARAAVASNYNCIVHNPDPPPSGPSPPGPRCKESQGVEPASSYRYLSETSFGADLSGDGTTDADDYCIVYVKADGAVAVANDGGCINCYGGKTASYDVPDDAPTRFYAMTDSCWNSFV